MHEMLLYECCIVICHYTPITIITITLKFNIGLWNNFQVFF